MEIEITPTEIRIRDEQTELVTWTVDEWTADPNIVPALANGIRLAIVRSDELRERLAK